MKLDGNNSVNFTLRMPIDQRIKLERISKKQGRTITGLINYIIQQYIENEKK